MDMFREFLSFLENEARCWDDAGMYCERCAANLPPEKTAELELICAVYRERAKMHRGRAADMRKRAMSRYGSDAWKSCSN